MLRAERLTKTFGARAVVDGVDLTIDEGTIAAVIGPNGAGKTTLLNLLSGFLEPSAGEVHFAGRRIDGVAACKRCRIGLGRTFQQPSYFPELTVAANVQVPLNAMARASRRPWGNARTARRAEALELLDAVELRDSADLVASSLSYGDRRRLEVAIALGTRPKALLLDEPMAGMSGAERRTLSDLIVALRRDRGLTVVFTEHDMDVVFALSEVVHVLHQGALFASGTPEQVRAHEGVRRVYLGDADGAPAQANAGGAR